MKAKVEELRLSRGQDWLQEWQEVVQSKELVEQSRSYENRTSNSPDNNKTDGSLEPIDKIWNPTQAAIDAEKPSLNVDGEP